MKLQVEVRSGDESQFLIFVCKGVEVAVLIPRLLRAEMKGKWAEIIVPYFAKKEDSKVEYANYYIRDQT